MATAIATIVSQARETLNERNALPPPGAPVVSPQGTPGAAICTYILVARTAAGTTNASPVGTVTTANATLSGVNFNQLTWVAVPKALTYDVYRVSGGLTQGKIGNTASTSFNDTGLVGDTTIAPVVNTSGLNRPFWSDTELTDLATLGIHDLWGAILDVHGEHYLTIDETNVSLAANATSLTGVPTDCFRVYLIEPRDTTSSGSTKGVNFVPRKFNSDQFKAARTRTAVDPSTGQIVYYSVSNVGAPIAAPTILTAPKLSSVVLLRFAYNPVLTVGTSNPIPGESDNALKAWIIAYARAKEREDRLPDSGWLAVYSTEKQSILVRLTPRQEQEPDVVEDFFSC